MLADQRANFTGISGDFAKSPDGKLGDAEARRSFLFVTALSLGVKP